MKTKNRILLSILFSLTLLSSASPVYKEGDKYYLTESEENAQYELWNKLDELHYLFHSSSTKSEITKIVKDNLEYINGVYYFIPYGYYLEYQNEKGDTQIFGISSFLEEILYEIIYYGDYIYNNKKLDYYLIKLLIDNGVDVSLQTLGSATLLKDSNKKIYNLIKKAYNSNNSYINSDVNCLNEKDFEKFFDFYYNFDSANVVPEYILFLIEKFIDNNPKFITGYFEYNYPKASKEHSFTVKSVFEYIFNDLYFEDSEKYLEKLDQIFTK